MSADRSTTYAPSERVSRCFGPQLVHHRLHLIVVKRFAIVAVKRDAQEIVDFHDLLDGGLLELIKQRQRNFVAVLDALEPGAAKILQLGILFRFLVELNVQARHLLHALFADGGFIAPQFIGGQQLAKLRAPIAQVVDAYALVAHEIVEIVQGMSNGRAGKVADMELLGDVDAAVIDAHRAPMPDILRAVALAF